jgi:selenide,water dikinase
MALAEVPGVTALTDVTGFGLMGHLVEMCEGSGVNAVLDLACVPALEPVHGYISQGCIPGGTGRNFDSYGEKLALMTDAHKALLCDPQTSGGLLIAVRPEAAAEVERVLAAHGVAAALVRPIGELSATDGGVVRVRFR